ncbi:hypothetical protein OM076_02865 [Solirubrobacter ginsenosidimutans]|uniref:Calcium-binding protein n=1 Tax=Solirubrobacter ginsenosidimutans TaxID=490573 RepID=A0A9X3RY23_9ACTN|nr:hypothetical protein [Solirubrobacter ginsenosidimutans]
MPCACEDESLTHGADTYVGGGGSDSVTYEGRSENLALSPDGVANDGAAGEGDNIAPDIGTVIGGHGSDVLTGNAGRNAFSGGEGDDVLAGGGSDDQLVGGPGADRLTGDDGQDVLGGDDGDDVLVGGEGVDRFWGDDVGACIAAACASGQDRIDARDGAREQISCGPGTDAVVADPIDVFDDSIYLSDQCEGTDWAAAAAPVAPPAFKALAARVDSRRRIVVRVAAPGAGVVKVRATSGRLRVAGASRKVAAAGETQVVLKPSRAARRALAKRHRLKVTVRVAFGSSEQVLHVTLRRR